MPENAIRKAYQFTDEEILENAVELGKGGSTAVTAILINCQKLVVANIGDSRAVISENGVAKQLSIDHDAGSERKEIEERGGFVTKFHGNYKINCIPILSTKLHNVLIVVVLVNLILF